MESRKFSICFNIMLAALLYLIMPSTGLASLLPGEEDPVYQAGLASFKKQDYNMAHNIWMRAAKAGNSSAQYRLGHLYMNGFGVRLSYVTARYWFAQAARKKHPMAQNDLGSLYLNGQGVARNVDKALYWYRESAAQGYAVAQYNAGSVLSAKKLYEEAIVFLKSAVMAGYSKANHLLTRTLRAHQGVIGLPGDLISPQPGVGTLPLPVAPPQPEVGTLPLPIAQ